MRRSTAIRLSAAAVACLDAAATVEALRTGRPVLAVITLLAAVVAVSLAMVARRPTVELRGDLARWTARLAAATGEAETEIVHRALARHRAALGDDQDRDDQDRDE